ncbi:sensory protein, containing eal-domain [Mariprofundus ferrooxydans PV-1]|uniref:Sensory protein, containing eal-domain n=2 Tax=Mariprofundus ferrooxydans TaxID=314344 RepID=Q0EXD1_9PROT|nr:sensory protein, containing eal-domain [Mariprofundus ferrooxydans PV-1]
MIEVSMHADLQQFLSHSLYPVYQPILDIKKQVVIGLESLTRSTDGVSPLELFAEAAEHNMLLSFDRSCRSAALSQFRDLGECSRDRLLFLNIDVSALDDADSVAGWIIEQVKINGLANSQVALEIVESKVESTAKLIDFVNRHRQAGFLIVLDDFGESHSNLNRVVQLKPDIIKIDKALIRDIQTDYYKQSIVQAIVSLSNKIGAITLAEGVETRDELFVCYEMGIQLYQGYYFSRPKQPSEFPLFECMEALEHLLPELNEHIAAGIQRVQRENLQYNSISADIISRLHSTNESAEVVARWIMQAHVHIDCVYLLNEQGIQISKTVCRTRSETVHPLFSPSDEAADHSYKEYYYYLKYLGTNRYISEPYISLATGNICRTVSSRFIHQGGVCILCVDFSV